MKVRIVIASEYDPWTVLEKLVPYLAGSASIVVHSPHVQILVDLQLRMRTVTRYLCPTVTEAWLRRYQVLPGRTHPTMVTSGSGGFILHSIRVHDDCDASAATMNRRQKRAKKKVESPESLVVG